MQGKRLLLSVALLCFAISSVSAKTIVRPPHLAGADTHSYSHLLWQSEAGAGIPITILPINNASNADWYAVSFDEQSDLEPETRTIPRALNNGVFELVKYSQFLEPVQSNSRFKLQVIIKDFETLYAPTGSDNFLNRGFAEIDRLWSQLNGDNKGATVELVMVLFDRNRTVLEIPIKATMDPCERTSEPMVFGPNRYQTFLNRFAASTSGQTFIAAVNRGLEEINVYLANQPLATEVIAVEDNSIILKSGNKLITAGVEGQLIYAGSAANTRRHRGKIKVVEAGDDYAIAYPLGVHIANVLPGDRVELSHQVGIRQFKRVGRRSFSCTQRTFQSIARKQAD